MMFLNMFKWLDNPKTFIILLLCMIVGLFVYDKWFNKTVRVKEVQHIAQSYEKPLEIIQDRIEEVEKIKEETKQIVIKEGMNNEKLYNDLMSKYGN